MWFAGLLLLDLYLLWWLSNAVFFLLSFLFAPYVLSLPRHVLEKAYVPADFVTLLSFWPMLVIAMLYFLFVKLPESKWLRFSPLWTYVRRHQFQLEAEQQGTLSHDDVQTIYAIVPHHTYAEAFYLCMVLNRQFQDVVPLVTSLLFWIPVCREIAQLVGARPITESQMQLTLDEGSSIMCVPEGMRGAIESDVLHTTPRLGFIRVAQRCKNLVVIVPVYIEGAHRVSSTYNLFPSFQRRMLSQFYYPFPMLAFGWYGTFWPKSTPLKVHYGAPIVVDCAKSTQELYTAFTTSIEAMKKL